MKTYTRVVVIGGGVVGCSVLYHLTEQGWQDVVLVERSDLTAGSTWHAAGGMHTLNGNPNVAALQDYTIKLYSQIEEESGINCGIHQTGCLYLAVSDREVEFFQTERAKARHLGIALDFIDLTEAKRLNPLIDISDYRAAMFDPHDGHIDPSGVTNAYAQAARNAGAQIYKHTPVTGLKQLSNDEWEVETDQGAIRCEYVVNAAGLWAREVGKLMGVELPILPMEHQYIVTNDIPELAALGREIPAAVDFDGAAYLRQEQRGLVLGTYEQDCRHWALDGTPQDFGIELLPADLDRLAEPLTKIMDRMPAIAEAGIKRIVNGGMVFSPDGNPIIGPVPGLPRAFVAAGVMAGFSQGGGVGLAVARWITEGEPGMDVFAMDLARYGDFADRSYVIKKTRENYQRRFILPCPNEELPAARPLRTSPLYDLQVEDGAVFGAVAGWEVPLWFAGSRAAANETPSFHRTQAFTRIRQECRAVREAVGLLDISSYCKIEIGGPGTAPWLDNIIATELPDIGCVAHCLMLTPNGRLLGDVALARWNRNRFWVIGSAAAEALYLRALRGQAPAAGVKIDSTTNAYGGLALMGPRAHTVLAQVTTSRPSPSAFPPRSIRELTVAGVAVTALSISSTGESGYELYIAPQDQCKVYRALLAETVSEGGKELGTRALIALRLEMGYGSWGREYTQDFTPAEAGLGHLVSGAKAAFIGREATRAPLDATPSRKLRLLKIEAEDPDPFGGEPVLHQGRAIARLTSATYGYTVRHSLGLAYLPSELGPSTTELEVEILGVRASAHVLEKAPYGPPHDQQAA